MSKTVQELAQLVGGQVVGDGSTVVTGITNFETPALGHVVFVQHPKYMGALEKSEVACIIVPPSITASSKPLIQVKEPKLAWAKLLNVFFPPEPYGQTVSPKASIAQTAKIGTGVTIEDFAVISERAEIGDGAVVRSFVFIGKDVSIGAKSILHPGAVVYEKCKLGTSVILHAGSVVGSDGFGYVHTAEGQVKVPQVGNVVIEDDVEIGACAAIDRATVGSTRIGRGCKIDNLVQIAHNVVLGPHTVISSQTGISGSCKIGSHVTMGGKVGLGDHVEIGDWTMVGAGAGFPSNKKVPPKQIVFGEPARPYEEARRQIAAQLRSAETLEDVRALKKKVAELEKRLEQILSAK
jgi:UDP-3-O-[3-hydroxymyristoyl] glucosamine N-acyltransferase